MQTEKARKSNIKAMRCVRIEDEIVRFKQVKTGDAEAMELNHSVVSTVRINQN